jgi:hypothetical protein
MLLIKGTQATNPFFRFMADALYILTLRMTQNITKVINEEEKIMLETSALFIHGFSSLTWLPKPPQMTCLLSTSRIITVPKPRAGSACQHAAPLLVFV